VHKLQPMKRLLPILLAFVVVLTGCQSTAKKTKKEALNKKTKADLREESTDVDFQAFIGRLRKAVAAHDMNTIASMMTTNFGYKLNPPLEGEGVFKYWDEQNLWPELEGILSEKFVKADDFMVAPPQFADKSLHYDGYRAGIRRVNGSWKFVYFVNG
jgi:predicted component of type VI protein secretion system